MSKNSLLKDSLSLTVSTIIVKILGLIYKMPLANLLGDEGMGYFNSAYTMYAFFYLLCSAGVPKAIMILVSSESAKEKSGHKYRILKCSLITFFIIGFLMSLLFMLLSGWLSSLIGNKGATMSMLAIAPSIVLISIGGVLRGYLSAGMKLLDIAVSQILEGAGRLVFGLLFAILATKLEYPLQIASALTTIGVSIGTLLGLLYLIVIDKKNFMDEKTGQSIKLTDFKEVIPSVLKISFPITLSAAVMSITSLIDLSLIMRGLIKSGYTEASASALYGNYTTLAVPMLNLAISLVAPVSIAIMPSLTSSFVRKNTEDFDNIVKNGIASSTFYIAPITVGLLSYAKQILSLLFGNSGIEVGSRLLILLIPAIFLSSLLIIVNSSLEAGGMYYAPMISMLAGALVKTFLSYRLISLPHIGISGAPIGTVCCYGVALCVSVILCFLRFKRQLPIFSGILKPYICAIAAVYISKIIYYAIEYDVTYEHRTVICIAICGFIYMLFAVLFGLVNIDKSKLSNYTNALQQNYRIRRN